MSTPITSRTPCPHVCDACAAQRRRDLEDARRVARYAGWLWWLRPDAKPTRDAADLVVYKPDGPV